MQRGNVFDRESHHQIDDIGLSVRASIEKDRKQNDEWILATIYYFFIYRFCSHDDAVRAAAAAKAKQKNKQTESEKR